MRIGLKGKEIPQHKRPASNLVFLVDVSGSMQLENQLPLVKKALRLLVEQLMAPESDGDDASGCRAEFIEMAKKTQSLKTRWQLVQRHASSRPQTFVGAIDRL